MKTPLNELLDFLDTQKGVPNIRVLVNQLGLLEKEKHVILDAFNKGYFSYFFETDGNWDLDYYNKIFGKDGMHT